jgi:hypothetical protein
MLFWAAAWKVQLRILSATIRAGAVAIVVFGLTGISALLLDAMLVPNEQRPLRAIPRDAPFTQRLVDPIQAEFTRWLADDPTLKLRRFPTVIANAFAPPALQTRPPSPRRPDIVGLTMEGSPNIFTLRDPFGLTLFLLLLVGGACSLALAATRPLAVASAAILAFCWLLSVWGEDTFLYSQHWQLAAVVLLAGVMRVGTHGTAMTVLLGLLTLVIALNNLMVVREMLVLLSTPPPALS